MQKPSRFILSALAAAALLIPLASSAQVIKSKVPVKKPAVVAAKKVVTPAPKAPVKKLVMKPAPKPVAKTQVAAQKAKPVAKSVAKNGRPMQGRGGTAGTISAINGTSITISSTSGTTYVVDASQTKFTEGISGLGISNMQVGDKIEVMGTVNGTTIAAKTINDQSFQGRNIFSGSVTAINGSSITIKGRNNVSYVINADGATITKGMGTGTTGTVSSIVLGDQITAIGSLNGSTVSTTAIRDMGKFQAGKGAQNWARK